MYLHSVDRLCFRQAGVRIIVTLLACHNPHNGATVH
jgi:hypothetical protein